MRRILRHALSDAAFFGGRLSRRADAGLRVLMYHRVTDAHPGDRLCVPTEQFARQMAWLRDHGYRTISFSQAVQWVKGESELTSEKSPLCRNAFGQRVTRSQPHPPAADGAGSVRRGEDGWDGAAAGPAASRESDKLVVLTFDDGFEDNVLYAAPALARHGFVGCFFVPSGFVEAGRHDGLAPTDRPMSWEQLRALLAQGHEVGAHSVSHRKLTTVSAEELPREVGACKQALEQGLGRGVDSFCYPAGDYNSVVKRTVESCGYLGACTVEPGANTAGADPFALKRTEISAFDTLWDFEKKLAGAYDWLHCAVQSVSRTKGVFA